MKTIAVDLNGSLKGIVSSLVGIEVAICSVLPDVVNEQLALATAAKEAGVSRFVPNFWGPVMPARGISDIREAVGYKAQSWSWLKTNNEVERNYP